MDASPEETIAFDRNTPRLIYFFGICCLFCYLSLQLAQGVFSESKGVFSVIIGWIGLVVFGGFLPLALIRSIKTPKTTLFFSPAGVLDWRLSDHNIPWCNIAKISQKTLRGQDFLGLELTNEGLQHLDLNRQGKYLRWANSIFSTNTLWIST